MSALDEARAALEAHLETGDAVAALEAFEAAVRANERSTPPPTPCTCRQAVHAREHTAFVHGCPWCHARETAEART